MYKYVLFVLLFIYIFDVPFVIGNVMIHGIVIVGFACFFLLCAKKKYYHEYMSLLLGRYHLSILVSLIIVAIYSIFATTLNGTEDYAYVRLCVHMIANIEIGVLLFGLFKAYEIGNKVITYIVGAFIAQALIQVFSYLFSPFNNMMNAFRNPTTLEYAKQYDGYRGLSISGSGFFGVAIAYGLLFVIIAYYRENWKDKNVIMKIVLLVIFIVAAISAGRSALFGIVFGLLYMVFSKTLYGSHRIAIKIKHIWLGMIILVLVCLGIQLCIKLSVIGNQSIKAFLYYIYSFVIGFFNGEGLHSSTSGQSLFQSFEYELSTKQIIFGDGRYIGIDGGANYMHQDSGFMRNLLLFGVGGLFFLFCTQFYMWRPCLEKNDKRRVLAIVICVMAIVYHIKGEVVGISIEFQSISFMLCLALTNSETHNRSLFILNEKIEKRRTK